MILFILLGLFVLAFFAFCIWMQNTETPVEGATVAKWLMSGVVLALFVMACAVVKGPIRLILTGVHAPAVVVGMAKSAGAADQDSLLSPVFEFITATGDRVKGQSRTFAPTPSAQVGDSVAIVYDAAAPADTQLLAWGELRFFVFMLAFIAFVLTTWMAAMLVSGDHSLDDPLGILPRVGRRLRLDPFRFPVLFILSLVIPACGVGTYVLVNRAIELRADGLGALGRVVTLEQRGSRSGNGSISPGTFAFVTYQDRSGAAHTIRRSAAWPLSRLGVGDAVRVLYPPRHPALGVVDSWDELYLVPSFFGLMALAFCILLAGVLRGAIRLSPGPRAA
ncbi:MAG: hypothetical protein JWO05_3218 [Gemmatimonadetes bacterium]|nr:hypothetical protein [Gemmatimonadota bacterium]